MTKYLKTVAVGIAALAVVRSILTLISHTANQTQYLLGNLLGNAILLLLALLLYRYASRKNRS